MHAGGRTGQVLGVQAAEPLGDLREGGAVVLGDGGFGAGDELQHAAPPRQVQLAGDLGGGDPTGAQVLHQLTQAVELEAAQQLGAARQGLQVTTVAVQGIQAALEVVEGRAGQVAAGLGAVSRHGAVQQHGKLVEDPLGLLGCGPHLLEVLRHGGRPGVVHGDLTPGVSHSAGIQQVPVQIGGEGGGSLQGLALLAQPPPHAPAHRHAVVGAPGLVPGGGHQLGQLGAEHGGLEGGEHAAHPVQQGDAPQQFFQGRRVAQADAVPRGGGGLAQLGQHDRAQFVDKGLGALGLGVGADGCAVPGGGLGPGGEDTHGRGLAQCFGVALAVLADHLGGHVGAQTHGGARGRTLPGQCGESGDRVVGGGLPGLLDAVHRLDVPGEDLAGAGELGRFGSGVLGAQAEGAGAPQTAQQGGRGVALERGIRGEVEHQLLDAALLGGVGELGEVAAALGDHQHAAATGVELLGQVHHQVQGVGAGRCGDREVLACQDLREGLAVVGVNGRDQFVLRR